MLKGSARLCGHRRYLGSLQMMGSWGWLEAEEGMVTCKGYLLP